ncbi:MAG: nucleotidyltransferase domain-containing protein [bacterium]
MRKMKIDGGLSESDMSEIILILQKESLVDSAFFFGSRAKGNYKKGSDVDIALKGQHLNSEVINNIRYILNQESSMPYKFDVVNYNSINSEELVEHINRAGKIFYSRK